jgi:putative ABC transport system permease protein
MSSWRRFFLRLANVFRPARAEPDLAREVASHLMLLEDDFERRGLTPEDARLAARRAFGGVEQAKDRHRDVRSFVWLDDVRRDVRHSGRLLRRNPIFAMTAALSLAIGIGADTAIFTVANGLLFHVPAGVADPARLVEIGFSHDGGAIQPGSYPNYLDVRERATTLDGVYGHEIFGGAMSLASPEGAERIFATAVTANYFSVLGVRPAAGRLFRTGDLSALASDDKRAEESGPILVLSHRFWTRRFKQDPGIVGRTVTLNGRAFTVVGVGSEGFQGTRIVAADVWFPLNVSTAMSTLTNRAGGWLVMGGRLKPGVSMTQASAELDGIGRALAREYPEQNRGKRLRIAASGPLPANNGVVAGFFAVLMGIVSLVLAVACANVAGVLLARAATRRREIAVRMAIGAGRARLVRQLLTETLMLFALGGAGGVLLARGMTSLIVSRLPALPFPVDVSLALDGRVIAFTIGLSLIAALLSGLAPALQTSKADVVSALKVDSQGPSDRWRLRNAFVVGQVALSLMLIVCAGLFVRALQRAGSINPGFDPSGVTLASLDLKMAGYTSTTGPRFARELVDRVRQLPSVQSATLARVVPGGFEGLGFGLTAPGVVLPDGQHGAAGNIVEPGYFATLRIPLVAGRDFGAADRDGAQPVAIVSEMVARQFWPGQPSQDAVGKYVVYQHTSPKTALVVGVARDVTSSSLIDGLAQLFVYVPLQQQYAPNVMIVARTAHGQPIADELRALVTSMNPNLPIVTTQTIEDSMALGLVPQRLAVSVSGSLGLVGLLLAAIGIYGVTAYWVTRQTREIGIRLALGAERAEIVRMVLRQGLSIVAIGSVIGLALAAGAGQMLAGFLFGVPPFDLLTFGGAAVLFAAIGLAACYGPARRATKVDPIVALRCD